MRHNPVVLWLAAGSLVLGSGLPFLARHSYVGLVLFLLGFAIMGFGIGMPLLREWRLRKAMRDQDSKRGPGK